MIKLIKKYRNAFILIGVFFLVSRLFCMLLFLFVFVCLLTAMIYPFFYFTDFVHNQTELADETVSSEAPTLLATNILFLRNLLLIATTVLLLNLSKSVKS